MGIAAAIDLDVPLPAKSDWTWCLRPLMRRFESVVPAWTDLGAVEAMKASSGLPNMALAARPQHTPCVKTSLQRLLHLAMHALARDSI
jgi:hypothetical protein